MLDKVQTSTVQYEPAVIQASDNPPSREISYKSILKKVCILTQLLWVLVVWLGSILHAGCNGVWNLGTLSSLTNQLWD